MHCQTDQASIPGREEVHATRIRTALGAYYLKSLLAISLAL